MVNGHSSRKAFAENINGLLVAGDDIVFALLVAPLQQERPLEDVDGTQDLIAADILTDLIAPLPQRDNFLDDLIGLMLLKIVARILRGIFHYADEHLAEEGLVAGADGGLKHDSDKVANLAKRMCRFIAICGQKSRILLHNILAEHFAAIDDQIAFTAEKIIEGTFRHSDSADNVIYGDGIVTVNAEKLEGTVKDRLAVFF